MKWFRFYSEFRADPKLRRMPLPHRYAFVILLCLAGEGSTRGVISGLDDDDIAYELEMPTEDWLTLKAKFRVKELIYWEGGSIFITNWDKRQFESDSSAERVAKHRAKKKKVECNVTSTLHEVTVTPCNALRTDTDSDSDPEKEELRSSTTACIGDSGESKHAVAVETELSFVDLGSTEPESHSTSQSKKSKADTSQKKSGSDSKSSGISFDREKAFIAAYNRLKPPVWPKVASMSGADREKWMDVFARQYGRAPDDVVAALVVIFKGVAADKWARMTPLKVSYLFTKSRYQDFYDIGSTVSEVPQYEQAIAMTDDPERLAQKIRFAEYLRKDEENQQRIQNG